MCASKVSVCVRVKHIGGSVYVKSVCESVYMNENVHVCI
jgi:hypothetical protein